MDGPGDYHSKESKSERERQIILVTISLIHFQKINSCKWNLHTSLRGTRKQVYKGKSFTEANV